LGAEPGAGRGFWVRTGFGAAIYILCEFELKADWVKKGCGSLRPFNFKESLLTSNQFDRQLRNFL
jgi:hypothetical protein